MNKKPSITIFVNSYLSFLHQGKSLAVGFKKLGYKTNVVPAKKEKIEEAYNACTGDVIISVGSWRDWPLICGGPISLGKKVFPWLVSDDKVLDFIDEMNSSPVIFTTSKFCKETFEKAGVKGELIQIIPEGIDTDFWKPVSKREQDKLKIIFPFFKNGKKIILLTIGGDGASKGVHEVLGALESLPLPDILYLIKTMPSEDAFFQGLKEKELTKKLCLNGKISHIAGNFSDEFIRFLFNICDVYVAPSRHEGFGLPHIQAMACQKPVITCKGTAAEETSSDKITGYVVSSEPATWENSSGYAVEGVKANIEELKDAIEKLALNEKLRKEMGKNARKHVLDNYDSKKIAKIFVEKMAL